MKKVSLARRLTGFLSFILLLAFLLVCAGALVVTIKSKKDSTGAVEIKGYRLLNVDSDSMAACELTDVSNYEIKSIPLRSLVVVQSVPKDPVEADAWYSQLKVGDVLTFQYVYHDRIIITHRIVSIEPDTEYGGYIIRLEGDNKLSEDGQLTQEIRTGDVNSLNYVMGKVVRQNFLIGFFISVLKEPIGVVLAIIVPCFVFILIEIIKVVNRSHDESNQKVTEMAEAERMAAMRRQDQKDRALYGTLIGFGVISLLGNWMTARNNNRNSYPRRRR